MLFQLQLIINFLIAQRAARLQLTSAFLIVFLLLFQLNHLEAVVAVLEGEFLLALLNVMFKQFRNFDILMAKPAIGQKLTRLC